MNQRVAQIRRETLTGAAGGREVRAAARTRRPIQSRLAVAREKRDRERKRPGAGRVVVGLDLGLVRHVVIAEGRRQNRMPL